MWRRGFSMLELAVVIGIIGILAALLIPAVQSSRSTARASLCKYRLRQLGVGLHSYHSAHSRFPGGTSTSPHVYLLPYFERQVLFDRFNPKLGAEEGTNAQITATSVGDFVCPMELADNQRPDHPVKTTSYAGNFGSAMNYRLFNGVLYWEKAISTADIIDGTSQTAAMAEILPGDGSQRRSRMLYDTRTNIANVDLFAQECRTANVGGDPWSFGRPWTSGDAGRALYNHINGPNQPSCTNRGQVQEGAYSAGSLHSGGVNVLFVDGHVAMVFESISLSMWRALGTRNGGEKQVDFKIFP